MCWDNNQLSLYTDASYDGKYRGIASVITDDEGNTVDFTTKKVQTEGILSAELMAINEGVKLAKGKKASLKSDNKTAISYINGEVYVPRRYNGLVSEIKANAKGNVSFMWNSRSENKVADALAVYALRRNQCC